MKTVIKAPTKIMSARIPVELHREIRSYCKARNLTSSEFLRKGLSTAEGGLFTAPDPDNNTMDFLMSLSGGGILGILAYKGVYGIIKEQFPETSNEHLEAYSIAAGAAVALLAGVGLSKLFKMAK